MPVTRWPSEQFRGKKSYTYVEGVLQVQNRISQAVVSEQVGCSRSRPKTTQILLYFSFIVEAQEKLKEHSYKKHGRDKKEDESLER